MTEIRVHFRGVDRTVTGKVGDSILELAEAHGIELDHACGGVCACSTCHVKVHAGAALLSAATEEEEDQLDDARGVELSSRLGCQARILRAPPQDGEDAAIEVSIPTWNVNFVREGGD